MTIKTTASKKASLPSSSIHRTKLGEVRAFLILYFILLGEALGHLFLGTCGIIVVKVLPVHLCGLSCCPLHVRIQLVKDCDEQPWGSCHLVL